MISQMDQLTVVGRRSLAGDVLQALQNLGVVQVDPLDVGADAGLKPVRLEGAVRQDADRWHELEARTEALLGVLEPYGSGRGAGRSEAAAPLPELESWLSGVGSSVDALVAERAEARDELDVIEAFLPAFRLVAPTLGRLEESAYVDGLAVIAGPRDVADVRQALDEALPGRYELAEREYGTDRILVLAALREDRQALRTALGRTGLAPLELPLRYRSHGTSKAVHVMEERSQSLPRRLSAVEEELRRLAASHSGKLRQVLAQARNHTSRYDVWTNLAEGSYGFALRGWVPSDRSRNVSEALKRQFDGDVVVETRAADADRDTGVPTRLENSSWARPFELLLSLFSPPAYGAFDPTWTVAVFFPLFFGIVVGDMGYGLLFLLLGLWLNARGKAGKELSLGPLGIVIDSETLPKIGTMTLWAAGWSIVWGFIFGEFLGNVFERWPAAKPIFYIPAHGDNGIIPTLLYRVEEFQPLLILCLGFGTLQVVGGWVIRAIKAAQHGDRKQFFEGIGMAAGLIALVVFAWAFMSNMLTTPVLVISGIGLLVFLISVALSGVFLMLVELISNSGHILSYLRLFAVGLSAALVANLSTDLGFAVSGVIPVPLLGPLLGIAVALTIHLTAIVLTIIGHTLQPLRLQYVEFFTKFGFYENTGRPYKPFRLTGGKA